MDPKTGEIFAMGATPSFNPNHFKLKKMSAFSPIPWSKMCMKWDQLLNP
jgi:cell division protein FtsI/penicillin-binding protein 2